MTAVPFTDGSGHRVCGHLHGDDWSPRYFNNIRSQFNFIFSSAPFALTQLLTPCSGSHSFYLALPACSLLLQSIMRISLSTRTNLGSITQTLHPITSVRGSSQIFCDGHRPCLCLKPDATKMIIGESLSQSQSQSRRVGLNHTITTNRSNTTVIPTPTIPFSRS